MLTYSSWRDKEEQSVNCQFIAILINICRYCSTYLGVVVRAGVVGLVVGKQGRCTFKVEAHVGRQVDVERIHVDVMVGVEVLGSTC